MKQVRGYKHLQHTQPAESLDRGATHGRDSRRGASHRLQQLATLPRRTDRSRGGVRAEDGKVPSMTSSSWEYNNLLLYPASIVGRRLNNGVRDDYNKDVPVSQCLEVHDTKGKARCLSTVEKDTLVSPLPEGRYPDAYNDEMRLMWRKLTPVECERLQTVPDNYTAHVSDTQRYKMLGNGFTVDVICHLLGGIDR